MTIILVLPELEKPLLEAAKRHGQDPETFAVNRLREVLGMPEETQAGSSLFDRLRGLVGTVSRASKKNLTANSSAGYR